MSQKYSDKKIASAVLSPLVLLPLQYLIIFSLTSNVSAVQASTKLIAGFFYIAALNNVLKKNKIAAFYTFSTALLIFLLNYLLFFQNRSDLLSVSIPLFLTCLPAFLYSYSIEDIRIFDDYTFYSAVFIYIVGVLMAVMLFAGVISMGGYSMPYSYYMLLPTIVFLRRFFEFFSVKYGLLSLISILIIVSFGARGPLLCIGAYAIMYKIINLEKISLKLILKIIVSFIILTAFWIYFKDLLMFFGGIIRAFGIKSRTVMLFLQDDISFSNRDSILEVIAAEISLNPFGGIGIAGDRFLTGTYTHNIFIEIISGFGIVFGSFILVLICGLVYNIFFQIDKKITNVILVWFAVGFVPLMISNSYLTHIPLWIFLGLALRNSEFKLKMRKSAGKESV